MRDDSSVHIKCNNIDFTTSDESKCPWYVKSPKHNNCLWAYIKSKSDPDGSMNEHSQSEIANLMGWSNTKTHFILKQVMEELVSTLKKYQANQLLDSDDDQVIEILTYDLDISVPYSYDDSNE